MKYFVDKYPLLVIIVALYFMYQIDVKLVGAFLVSATILFGYIFLTDNETK